jgi:hypothetical protein
MHCDLRAKHPDRPTADDNHPPARQRWRLAEGAYGDGKRFRKGANAERHTSGKRNQPAGRGDDVLRQTAIQV